MAGKVWVCAELVTSFSFSKDESTRRIVSRRLVAFKSTQLKTIKASKRAKCSACYMPSSGSNCFCCLLIS